MTGQAIAPARETAARARENGEYVRSLLKVRQPQFAVALESAVQKLLRDHRMVSASPRAGRPRCPPGRPASCGSDRNSSTSGPTPTRSPSAVGPTPDGDAVVTMPADTLYSLVTGQTTVTDAVRHSTVDGDAEIARRALEPLAAALTRPAPAI